MRKTISPGIEAEISNTVTVSMCASAFAVNDGEVYPEVLSTPYLIANMERACAKLLEPLLEPGQLSVGAYIDISHFAPSAVGSEYTATAKFVELKEPIYWFEVVAQDSAGKIGKGRIGRAIVDEATITATAQERLS